jgi:hypothetical protein
MATKHIRQQIREAAATKIAEITDFGGRVYTSRTRPHVTLPDAVVKTDDDAVLSEFTADHQYIRSLALVIEVRVKLSDYIENEIDDLCRQVEEKMMADPTLGSLLKNLDLLSTKIEKSQASDKPTGVATIEYDAWYRMLRTTASAVVD